MDKFKIFFALLTAAAVPMTAFVLRMIEGDTNNDNEEIISRWVRKGVAWITNYMTKEVPL